MESKAIAHIDSQTFIVVYNLYYKQLCRFLVLYTQDKQIVEDVVQEVFVKLWDEREKLSIEYIKTYLFHMARNKLLNHLRNSNNRNKLIDNWYKEQLLNESSEDCFDVDNFYLNVRQAIEKLPPKCKEVFLLNRNDQLSYKQISEKKSLSVKTVENHIGIALKKLRGFLIEPSLKKNEF
jgi:RNA polymerase sigma-70 factor (family 1)